MSLITSGRLALSALALCALTACGGGGDSGSSTTQSLPEDGKVAVITATSSTPAATYTVNVASGDADTITYGGEVIEYAESEDTSGKFMVGVAFQRSNPANYAIVFEDDSDDYMCAGGTLNSTQVAGLNAALGTHLTQIPTCPAGVTIDAAGHRVRAINVRVPGLSTAGKSVTLSANIGWTLK
jgi:hypothetical protein